MSSINAVYPDSIITEYHNGTDWINISRYVVSDITGNSGMASPRPDDRVATLGIVSLELNNVDRLFTPYGGDAVRGIPTLTGFNKGAKIRTRVVIKGQSKTVWTGRIDDIKSDDALWGTRRAYVTCVDWMDVASRFPMKRSPIELNKRINEAAESILARLSIQPEDTDFDEGDEIFSAVFSNVKDKTKAITELNKLTLSELGYLYLKQDGTLRIENSSARKGTRSLDKVPVHPDKLDTLFLLDGNEFGLLSGDTLLLAEAQEAQIAFSAEKKGIELADDVINGIYARAYPTRTATSLEVVFNLGSPIPIAGGTSVPLTGYYRNPSGGNPINATNQQTPVATTDYLFNTREDGLGSDITGNLTVTAVYYGDLVDYVLSSSYSGLGYVTKLQARGYGIYYDSPIDYHFEDGDSISEHGDTVIELDQKYKKSFYEAIAYGNSIIEQYKMPRSRVKWVKFLANLNHEHMMAALYLDVGSLVKVYEERSAMSKYYYIFSRKFILSLSGIIFMTFGCIEIPCVESGGLNPVGLDFEFGNADFLDFGIVPRYEDLYERSFSTWIRLESDVPGGVSYYNIQGFGVIQLFSVKSPLYLQYYEVQGVWRTPNDSLSTGNWIHVVYTKTNDESSAPKIYLDGVEQTVTVAQSPGAHPPETARHFVIGNAYDVNNNYQNSFDGQIRNTRYYSGILTQADVDALYDAGKDNYSEVIDNPDVELLFHGFMISSDLGDASSLDGQTIPTGNKYFENVYRYVGEPSDTLIIKE